MRRCIVIAVISFGLSFLVSDTDSTHASHLGTDLIQFMASTRGIDYDGDGKLEWCWTQYYHGRFGNALDEVPQRGANDCPSLSTEAVDLMAYGWTSWPSCTTTSSCFSLRVAGIDGTYADGCDYIEATLYDYLFGYWKGKQRMVHARDPYSGWTVYIEDGEQRFLS